MKQVHLSTVAAMLTVTSAAWAAGGQAHPSTGSASAESANTRAEVIAELHEAQRLGKMASGEADYPNAVLDAHVPTKTRAEVIAELDEAQRLGKMSNGEGDYPNVVFDSHVPTKTRAEVIAELDEAKLHSLLSFSQSGVYRYR